jgi:hypothetical protein
VTAFAKPIHHTAWTESTGEFKISKTIKKAIPQTLSPLNSGAVDATLVRWGASMGRVDTQVLYVDERSWAQQNLSQVISQGTKMSSAEAEAVRAALGRMRSRTGEDEANWAHRLGSSYGSLKD